MDRLVYGDENVPEENCHWDPTSTSGTEAEDVGVELPCQMRWVYKIAQSED